MYNQAQKALFMQQYTTEKWLHRFAKKVFLRCEPFEIEYGKDICALTTEEMQSVVDKVGNVHPFNQATQSATYYYTIVGLLLDYTKWCIKNRIPGSSKGVLRIRIDGLEHTKKTMFSTPEELQAFLDRMLRPERDNTVDIVSRCWAWLLFAGIKDTDTCRVRNDDVDLKEMTVALDGFTYYIPSEAKLAFTKAVELDAFLEIDNTGNRTRTTKRQDNGLLLRRGTKSPYAQIHWKKQTAQSFGTKNRVTPVTIYRSGVFIRTYEEERAGNYIDFNWLVMQNIEDTTSPSFLASLRLYREYYLLWKITFHRFDI